MLLLFYAIVLSGISRIIFEHDGEVARASQLTFLKVERLFYELGGSLQPLTYDHYIYKHTYFEIYFIFTMKGLHYSFIFYNLSVGFRLIKQLCPAGWLRHLKLLESSKLSKSFC